MNRRYLIGGLLVALVVVGGLSVVAYTGVDPVPGSEPVPESDIEEFPTETGAEQADAEEPFTFTIDEIENCGRTCRDVTATVTNTQTESAAGVTVYTRIFAGENSTDERVWEGTEEIGSLAANDSDTSTKRVDLSLGDAFTIRQNDGWITIVTTIESDEETVTVRETRQVI